MPSGLVLPSGGRRSVRSGLPAGAQVDRTYRWPDRWEPLEDILSLLAEQATGQLPDDAPDPHDALFALLVR